MPEHYITVPGEKGSVYISKEVVAEIAGAAISETEGVAGLTNAAVPDFNLNNTAAVAAAAGSGAAGERRGGRTSVRGVSIGFDEGRLRVCAAIYAKYGESIAAIGERAQEAAAATLESMTGLKSEVAIHVAGVVFDK